MTSVSLLHMSDSDTACVLEDLIRESLRVLLPATAFLAWIWAAATALFVQPRVVHAYTVLAVIAGTLSMSYLLHQRHLGLAVGLYLSGLTVAVTVIAVASRASTVLYLYLLVLLITATLTNPVVTWGMAVVSAVLIFIVGTRSHGLHSHELASPVIFVLLTALTSWLSSRRLLTALGWALNMTEEAQKSATEARERRAEVRSILKSLDEAYARLERANEALIFAREAAEKAYRFKAEFVANVSHELRTPLNLIVGFSEMVATAPESYKGTPLPSEYRGDVMAIYRSARHLSDLINDVLDLSQIEAGRLPLEKEPADLGEVIREATSIVYGLAEAKGLRLEVDLQDALPPLRLDRTRIRQVLLNLLTNATRYTDKGWIRVRACLGEREVRVSVEDSGRGIAPDKIARAFEVFSYLDEDRPREGSGLGLAVSKKFVELHGGTMWVESVLERGTTVAFTLPLPDGDREIPPSLLKTSTPTRGRGIRRLVLVLHDDPHAVAMLRRYVEGYEFLQADGVDRAVEMIRDVGAVAVIVDASWESRWVQNASRCQVPPQVPVLIGPLPGVHRLGDLLGAAGYLAKPVMRSDIAAALARLPSPPRTVLVVDDDPNFVRLVTRVLKADDPAIRVLEASGGAEGLALARAQQPDLVLLDLLMPEVSGYDFLQEARRDDVLARVPVIIMSARGIEQETAPIAGEFWLRRAGGFAPGEILHLIQAMLPAISQPGAMAPASAAAPPGDLPGQPAW